MTSRRSRRSYGKGVSKHAERRILFESNGGEKECRMVSADHVNHPMAQLRIIPNNTDRKPRNERLGLFSLWRGDRGRRGLPSLTHASVWQSSGLPSFC